MSKRYRVVFIDGGGKRAYVSNRNGENATEYPQNAYLFSTSQAAHAIARKLKGYQPFVQDMENVHRIAGLDNPAPSAQARSRKLKAVRSRTFELAEKARHAYGPNSHEYRQAWKKHLRSRDLYAGSSGGKKKSADREKIRNAYQKLRDAFEEALLKKFKPRGASNARRIFERFPDMPSKAQDSAMPYAEPTLGPKLFALYKKVYKARKILHRAGDRDGSNY